jgi:phosphate starvation-inducible protein PhoH
MLAAGITAGVGVLGNLFTGGSQKKRGRKMLREAQKLDPGYQIPTEFNTNLGQAEQMSKVGMPSEQYNLAGTNIQRNSQAGLRQLGRMSNPFAGIAGLQRGQNDAFAQLDAQNAAVRRQNILQAMGVRKDLAGQKLAAQQYQQQKYFDAVNQANAMIGAGMKNQNSAFSGLTQLGTAMASNKDSGK